MPVSGRWDLIRRLETSRNTSGTSWCVLGSTLPYLYLFLVNAVLDLRLLQRVCRCLVAYDSVLTGKQMQTFRNLKKMAVGFFETSATIYQSTWCNVAEDLDEIVSR